MIKVSPIGFEKRSNSKQEVSNVKQALEELKTLEFLPADIAKVKQYKLILPYKSGKEVYDYIIANKTKIEFDNFDDKNVHAQWDYDANTIKLNALYRNTTNRATILALSSSIMHEAGHAKDQDRYTSIQEELECLALNALAHSSFEVKYPNVFVENSSPIVKNGVQLYADLYFKEADSRGIVERMKSTYNELPAGDFKHPPGRMALDVKM